MNPWKLMRLVEQAQHDVCFLFFLTISDKLNEFLKETWLSNCQPTTPSMHKNAQNYGNKIINLSNYKVAYRMGFSIISNCTLPWMSNINHIGALKSLWLVCRDFTDIWIETYKVFDSANNKYILLLCSVLAHVQHNLECYIYFYLKFLYLGTFNKYI